VDGSGAFEPIFNVPNKEVGHLLEEAINPYSNMTFNCVGSIGSVRFYHCFHFMLSEIDLEL